jgi:hypothetical protein
MKFLCGWISPSGQYFEVPKGTHIVWLSDHLNQPSLKKLTDKALKEEFDLYHQGWIHVGSEGHSTITLHKDNATPKSKSFNYLKSWLKDCDWIKPIEVSVVIKVRQSEYISLTVDELLKKRKL